MSAANLQQVGSAAAPSSPWAVRMAAGLAVQPGRAA